MKTKTRKEESMKIVKQLEVIINTEKVLALKALKLKKSKKKKINFLMN